jgi:hypothetical protein
MSPSLGFGDAEANAVYLGEVFLTTGTHSFLRYNASNLMCDGASDVSLKISN